MSLETERVPTSYNASGGSSPCPALWYRGGLWLGALLSIGASVSLLVNMWRDVALLDLPNLCVAIHAGELSAFGRIGRMHGSSVCGLQPGWTSPRAQPLRWSRAWHTLHLNATELHVAYHFPLWTLVASGTLLAALSRTLLRSARFNQRKCLRCGYDLRGTPGDRCSECGLAIRAPMTLAVQWLQSRGRKALAVYFVVGLLWSGCNKFHASGRTWWWPDPGGLSGFVVQLCGPFGWVLSPYWPFVNSSVGSVGEVLLATVLAVVLWTAWGVAVLVTRLRDLSLALHATAAVVWFCLGPPVVGLLTWVVFR